MRTIHSEEAKCKMTKRREFKTRTKKWNRIQIKVRNPRWADSRYNVTSVSTRYAFYKRPSFCTVRNGIHSVSESSFVRYQNTSAQLTIKLRQCRSLFLTHSLLRPWGTELSSGSRSFLFVFFLCVAIFQGFDKTTCQMLEGGCKTRVLELLQQKRWSADSKTKTEARSTPKLKNEAPKVENEAL